MFFVVVSTLCLCISALLNNAATSTYNWSPSSREVSPKSVLFFGNVTNLGPISGLNDPANTYVFGSNALITYDFGQITSGLVSISTGQVAPGTQFHISFTESSLFIGNTSDQSLYFTHDDGSLALPVDSNSHITLPPEFARGAFRYVTVSASAGSQIRGISNYFTAMPGSSVSDLRNYTGFFHSSDDLLNRIWYAGAYTTQLCLISANSSVYHNLLAKPLSWANNATVQSLEPADSFLADGAKRDRSPWAGDLSVAVASVEVTHNRDNLTPVKNALKGMLIVQNNDTDYFPYAGSPLGDVILASVRSDTYHMWTMFGFADYILRSNDTSFGRQHASQIVRGLEALRSQIDPSRGLFNGSGSADWGRNFLTGETTSANAIFYATIQIIRDMSNIIQSPELNQTYIAGLLQTAEAIKTGMNTYLFDSSAGLFYDNTTARGRNLYPQDGNSFAVQYNLTTSIAQAQNISAALANRLGLYGAPAPEFIGGIAPFAGSHELEAHFTANPTNSTRAIKLLKTQWGYMQSFSASTHVEGYATNGSLSYPFYGTSSFISHVHAWSTGPTSTLLNRVLGITAGTTATRWSFAPHYLASGLTSCEGGYYANGATFAANWTLSSNNTFSATLSVTNSTSGVIRLPVGSTSTVTINGTITRPDSIVDGVSIFDNVPAGMTMITAT